MDEVCKTDISKKASIIGKDISKSHRGVSNIISFLHDCENDIVPNILEAMVRGNLEVLRDCFESTYNIITTPLTTPIAAAQKLGYYELKISDIENVDLAMVNDEARRL